MRYVGEETLAETAEQGGLTGLRGTRLWSSPEGDAHALACGEHGEYVAVAFLTYPLAALAGRPMREMTRADLAAIVQMLSGPECSPAARPVLELLRSCLEYRSSIHAAFGTATHDLNDISLSAG